MFKIRNAEYNDIALFLKWAENEGWNPGLNDIDPFFSCDENGFFIGELDGKPICCISAVSYGDDYGFIGFYIVLPEYRGKGYGYRIWKNAMDNLKGRNVGLDGVVEQQPNYKKSGFVLKHKNIRYRGISKKKNVVNVNISLINRTETDKVIEYDERIFGCRRDSFLNKWLNMDQSVSLIYKNTEGIKGYSTIRKCHEGYKIGPLFADNEGIAIALADCIFDAVPEDSVYFLDIPQNNESINNLINRYSLQYVFETARMYTETYPVMDVTKCFGVTTFELG